MAAQLYAETQIAECLYEVLNEMVTEGLISETLASTTFNQVGQGRHHSAECSRQRAHRSPGRIAWSAGPLVSPVMWCITDATVAFGKRRLSQWHAPLLLSTTTRLATSPIPAAAERGASRRGRIKPDAPRRPPMHTKRMHASAPAPRTWPAPPAGAPLPDRHPPPPNTRRTFCCAAVCAERAHQPGARQGRPQGHPVHVQVPRQCERGAGWILHTGPLANGLAARWEPQPGGPKQTWGRPLARSLVNPRSRPPGPQVWQFVMSDVVFKLNPTGVGSIRKGVELRSPKMRMVCVDAKLAAAAMPQPDAGPSGGAGAASASVGAAGKPPAASPSPSAAAAGATSAALPSL